MAICREFPLPAFEVRRDGARLTLETEAVRLEYDGQPFSSEGLSVTLKGATLPIPACGITAMRPIPWAARRARWMMRRGRSRWRMG